jgi:hypothetical protein
MRPDIREQSLPRRLKTGMLAIGEGSIYGRSDDGIDHPRHLQSRSRPGRTT